MQRAGTGRSRTALSRPSTTLTCRMCGALLESSSGTAPGAQRSGRRAVRMLALGDLLDDLACEGVKVVRIARGDHTLIVHDGRILPLAAGVDHVRLDRVIRGHALTLGDAGLDQQRGCMTYR